jgi:hypothetical protein
LPLAAAREAAATAAVAAAASAAPEAAALAARSAAATAAVAAVLDSETAVALRPRYPLEAAAPPDAHAEHELPLKTAFAAPSVVKPLIEQASVVNCLLMAS